MIWKGFFSGPRVWPSAITGSTAEGIFHRIETFLHQHQNMENAKATAYQTDTDLFPAF